MTRVEIINNTRESRDLFGHAYGSEIVEVSKKQLNAIVRGKCLALDDGEYVTFIVLKKDTQADYQDYPVGMQFTVEEIIACIVDPEIL